MLIVAFMGFFKPAAPLFPQLYPKISGMKSIWVLLGWILLPLAAAAQVSFTSSNLPIILIQTNGQEIPDEPKIMATMQVIDHGPGQLNQVTDPPNDYTGYIGIERRGSTSQDLSEKKPYAVETRAADSSDFAFPLLGMPAESDWVFLAPYSDKSLLRDALALQLARQIMPWAARSRFVELVLNGQYQGIYLVAEKIKRDAERVAIKKIQTTDVAGDAVTGGYIIKIDKTTGAFADGWTSPFAAIPGQPQTTYYQYDSPRPEDIVPAQKQYIQQWMTNFETMAQGPNFSNPTTGYPAYLDVASFVDFVLLNEVSKNVDAYRLSTYFYKDRDSEDPRLHAGPVWDFNIAFSNADYCGGGDYAGWAMDFNQVCAEDYWVIHFWWTKLWQDPNFRLQVRNRWQQLRADIFTDNRVLGQVDSMATLLSTAQTRNFQQWPILNDYVWPNVFCCGTYNDHTTYLRNWLIYRLQWMDNAMETFTVGVNNPQPIHQATVSPNPSYGTITFQYETQQTGPVLIQVFDQTGRQVGEIKDQPLRQGKNEYHWAYTLPSGIYYFTVKVNGKLEAEGQFLARPE